MKRRSYRGKVALITGASSGIGTAFAQLLARGGSDLILAARRLDRLEALRDELVSAHGVNCDVFTVDLGRPDGAKELFEQVESLNRPVDLLVNNAGIGIDGVFATADWEAQRQMIQLNVITPVELTRLFLPGMLERNSGDVLLVASIGAFMPVPFMANYTASKAYLRFFGEALGHELRKTGVRVTVVNPGGTETEFQQVAGMKPRRLARLGMMKAEKVARIGLRAMSRGRRSVITGVMNKLMIWMSTRFLPLGLRLRAAERFQKTAGGGNA